jgi:hypothetical protein
MCIFKTLDINTHDNILDRSLEIVDIVDTRGCSIDDLFASKVSPTPHRVGEKSGDKKRKLMEEKHTESLLGSFRSATSSPCCSTSCNIALVAASPTAVLTFTVK